MLKMKLNIMIYKIGILSSVFAILAVSIISVNAQTGPTTFPGNGGGAIPDSPKTPTVWDSAATATLSIEASDATRMSGKSYDFFGNNLADFAIFTFSQNGQLRWRVLRNDNPTSSAPNAATIFDIPWGLTSTDLIPQVGDYDGNGVTDLSIYRNSDGNQANSFYTLPLNGSGNAPGNPVIQQLGNSLTDIVGGGGDYDGDGKMDYTVVRDTNGTTTSGGNLLWYVLKSSDNTFLYYYYGKDDDIVLGGADYTGDGFDNPTVVRIGGNGAITWLVGSSSGDVIRRVQWGNFNTDFVIPGGDYDGDGKADFMVWRGFGDGTDGVWYLLTSSGNMSFTRFGIPGSSGTRDTSLRGGDYDGDGKDDIAIYRNSEMRFYILRSSDGGLISQQWGVPGNTNLPVAQFGIF